eukprot:CAMPEP_0178430964 /NCGR_PEP_ID=MMETSP0689_2-20121128/31592_1 /TAXON_ID=160604 /ORGANISM="Amphidinium massartii, Strain CS-259" /LENGTH=47 /DNA_ID= /DNA_START= /DNA_END= /DNA_ORIENTATION=
MEQARMQRGTLLPRVAAAFASSMGYFRALRADVAAEHHPLHEFLPLV